MAAFKKGDVVALRGAPQSARSSSTHWSVGHKTSDPRWGIVLGEYTKPIERYDVGVIVYDDHASDADLPYLIRNFIGDYVWVHTSLIKHANQEEQEDARVQAG